MTTQGRSLREGFTTGTAATAAAMAALETLLAAPPTHVSVPLPPFAEDTTPTVPSGWLDIHVLEASLEELPALAHTYPARQARAVIQKDGGDDPDATHKARITASASLLPSQGLCAHLYLGDGFFIEAGEGIGRVTLPGLPVPVGEPAINPVPRQQLRYGLGLVARRYGHINGAHVLLSVVDGARLARSTLNPRLGIVDGISLLGTQGTVKPFSHKAWKATILQGMNVALATSCTTLYLCTGRRSEKVLLTRYPHLPPQAVVQVADFAAFSLKEAAKRPFTHLAWACFFGKLVKLAQGHTCTHARTAPLNFALLARWCAEAGSDRGESIARCITAGHAMDILLAEGPVGMTAIRTVAKNAAAVASRFAGRPVRIHLFHMHGMELVQV